MSVRRRRKGMKQIEYEDAELNLMPFIDVFSVLNTFLLFSAVFVSMGITKVYIPFLSNKEEPPDKPTRSFEITVDAATEGLSVITRYTTAPYDEKVVKYELTEAGLADMHALLVTTRLEHTEIDKVKLLTEDSIKWQSIIDIIDAIKMRRPEDPMIEYVNEGDGDTEMEPELINKVNKEFIFPKVIMGSVIL